MPPHSPSHHHHDHEHGHDHEHSHVHDHVHHHDHAHEHGHSDHAPIRRLPLLRWLAGFGLLGLLVLLLVRSVVVVDETEFALMTSFGRPLTLYGDQPGESGPHWRWPWHAKWSIDKRLQAFTPANREVITSDKQNLEVGTYLLWRVAEPRRFLEAAGTIELAQARLDDRVAASLGQAIGKRPLAAMASTDPRTWALDTLQREILNDLAPQARGELGIEIVDVGLQQFVHPLEVRPAVFDLIKSERQQVAAALRAEAEADYQTVVSQAQLQASQTIARAEADAHRTRAEAEAQRTRLLNEAQALDPAFAAFLQNLESYGSMLDQRSTVVLSTASPLFRLFTEGPDPRLIERLEQAPPSQEPSGDANP